MLPTTNKLCSIKYKHVCINVYSNKKAYVQFRISFLRCIVYTKMCTKILKIPDRSNNGLHILLRYITIRTWRNSSWPKSSEPPDSSRRALDWSTWSVQNIEAVVLEVWPRFCWQECLLWRWWWPIFSPRSRLEVGELHVRHVRDAVRKRVKFWNLSNL